MINLWGGRRLAVLFCALALAGCSAKYRTDSIEAPTTRLDRDGGFYVTWPENGSYDGQEYAQSGQYAMDAVETALLARVHDVETAKVQDEDLTAAIAHAKERGLAYVFEIEILHWEDRATEWSGVTDKVTLKYAVVDVETGKPLTATVARASSKWGSLGGDHPQDLLPETAKRFVDQLF